MDYNLHSPRKISNFALPMYKHLNSMQSYNIFLKWANKILIYGQRKRNILHKSKTLTYFKKLLHL